MHVYMVAGHGSVAVPSTQTIVCPRSRSHQAMFILPFTNYQLLGIFGDEELRKSDMLWKQILVISSKTGTAPSVDIFEQLVC